MNCCKLLPFVLLSGSAFGQSVIDIASPDVTAGDLAHEVAVFAQADAGAIVARAPAPGVSRRVARAELQRWADSLGLKPKSLPEELTLRRPTRLLTSAEIEDAARTGTDADGVSVEILSAALPSIPTGQIELECLCSRLALNQPAPLRLRWREPGGRTGIELVQAVIRVEGRWFEAATDLPAGAALKPWDVVQRRGPLPGLDSYLAPEQLDEAQLLVRSVKAGQPLTDDLISSAPLVSRGDLVELRYEVGGIRLRSPGRAEASGGRGEVIPFHNVATGGRVSARLVDPKPHIWRLSMLLVRLALPLLAILGPLAAQTAPEALGRYRSRTIHESSENGPSAGSLFLQNSYLADLARDARASQIGDLVTIAISEQASALTSGSLTQSRSSSSDSAVNNLLGVMAPLGGLPNLFNQDSDTSLDGSGSTGRQMAVTAVVTAHVVEVMPNGNLIIEGTKEISVNAERQLVVIRGVVRQADLRTDNSVSSDRIALMDLRVNGKGVVNEAIRRPNALYRIFRRLLPF